MSPPTPIQDSWTIEEKESGDGVECGRSHSSGHDVAIALLSSQQLWLPTQDQAQQHSGMEGRKDGKAPNTAHRYKYHAPDDG